MFGGPSRLCFGRYLVFHRFDQGAHDLNATLQVQPTKAESLPLDGFSLF
jgi:hypothetical protein